MSAIQRNACILLCCEDREKVQASPRRRKTGNEGLGEGVARCIGKSFPNRPKMLCLRQGVAIHQMWLGTTSVHLIHLFFCKRLLDIAAFGIWL